MNPIKRRLTKEESLQKIAERLDSLVKLKAKEVELERKKITVLENVVRKLDTIAGPAACTW